MATHNSTSDADEHGGAAQPEASKEAGRTNEDETPGGQGIKRCGFCVGKIRSGNTCS